MKTMHYPNTIRFHLVTVVPMAPFTPKSTSKLRSALHIRYSKVITLCISRTKPLILLNPNNLFITMVFLTLLTTTTTFIVTI